MLSVENLTRPGIQAASFDLDRGECLALRGPSGSGKSLLLRALADLDPSDGRVSLDGEDRFAMTGPDWRRRVTYVAAEPGWWSENLADHFADWPAALALAEQLLLSPAIVEQPLRLLSTGERQRFALIRALQHGPRVLLLDEPTGPLDEAATAAVESLLAEQRQQGTSLLWVTHDAAQATRVSSRAMTMSDGRLDTA